MEGVMPSTFHRVFLFDGNKYGTPKDYISHPKFNTLNDLPNIFANLTNPMKYNGNVDVIFPSPYRFEIIPIKYENGHLMCAFSPSAFNSGRGSQWNVGNDGNLYTFRNKNKVNLVDIPDEYQWFYVDDIEIYDKSSDGIEKADDATIKTRNYYSIGDGVSEFGMNYGVEQKIRDYTHVAGETHSLSTFIKLKGRNDKSAPPIYKSYSGKTNNNKPESIYPDKNNYYPNRNSIKTHTFNRPTIIDGLLPVNYQNGQEHMTTHSSFEGVYNKYFYLNVPVYDGNRLIKLKTSLTNSTQFHSFNVDSTINNINYKNRRFNVSSHRPTGGVLGRLNRRPIIKSSISFNVDGKLSKYRNATPNVNVITPLNRGVEYRARNKNLHLALTSSSFIKSYIEIAVFPVVKGANLFISDDGVPNITSKNNLMMEKMKFLERGVDIASIIAIGLELNKSYSNEIKFAEVYNKFLVSNNYEDWTLTSPQTQTYITKQGDAFKNRKPFRTLPVNRLFKSVKEFDNYIHKNFPNLHYMGYYENFLKVNVKPWIKSDYNYVWELWGNGLFYKDRYEVSKGRDENDTDIKYSTN